MASEKIPKSTNEKSCHLTTINFSASHSSKSPCLFRLQSLTQAGVSVSLISHIPTSAPSPSSTWQFSFGITTIQFHEVPLQPDSSKTHASLPLLSSSIKFMLLHLHEMLPSASQVLQIHTHHKTSPKHLLCSC